jgi:RNA recognition motif-containing protein
VEIEIESESESESEPEIPPKVHFIKDQLFGRMGYMRDTTVRAAEERPANPPAKVIFVQRYDPASSFKDLEEHFAQYGTVTKSNFSRKFGFVCFEKVWSAKKAVAECHGSNLFDSEKGLNVEFSQKQPDEVGVARPLLERRERRDSRDSRGRGEDNVRDSDRNTGFVGRPANPPAKVIFVQRYDPASSFKDLEEHFAQYGTVTKSNFSRKFGFVCFEKVESAKKAVAECHGSNLFDSEKGLNVEFSQKQPDEVGVARPLLERRERR